MRAERPDAEEARPAAVGKLFSEAMWRGEEDRMGREGFADWEERSAIQISTRLARRN